MIPKALVAASLQPIILSLLAHGDAYGYQIIQRIETLSNGKLKWTAGTMYPVLHRLETKGLIEAFWRPSESGPRRKYYRLTDKGHGALDVEKSQWLDVHAVLLRLWAPELSFT